MKPRKSWSTEYQQLVPDHVYPVEFVVRAFLSRRSPLREWGDSPGGKALDIGFGDGRNVPLLSNLGFEVYGVEISAEICEATTSRMRRLGIDFRAAEGRNRALPFGDDFFDTILACHACYYVDDGSSFSENLAEIARVLKPGGTFVFSAPMPTSYILNDAVDHGGGHMEIVSDPYGLREGTLLKKFEDEEELRSTLEPDFGDIHIGNCQNDFWGIEEHVWTCICRRT